MRVEVWGGVPLQRKEGIMKPLQNGSLHLVIVQLVTLGLCLAAAAPAAAQIGFEPPDYTGSSDGVLVAGQQGWYTPDVMGTQDEYVYTYDGNALGLPANTTGDTQFLGAQVSVDGSLARAQLDNDWSASTVWTVSYDIAAGFNGTLPARDNLGSFSLHPSTTARYFIGLNTWADIFTAVGWNTGYLAFDPDGTMFVDPASPGPEWQNLAVDHWYRQSTTFDFDSNSITSVSITDLDTGSTATVAPTGWYLAGGAGGGGMPLPTALRFFVGGGGAGAVVPGNVMGWDNLAIDAGGSPATPTRGESRNAQPMPIESGSVTN